MSNQDTPARDWVRYTVLCLSQNPFPEPQSGSWEVRRVTWQTKTTQQPKTTKTSANNGAVSSCRVRKTPPCNRNQPPKKRTQFLMEKYILCLAWKKEALRPLEIQKKPLSITEPTAWLLNGCFIFYKITSHNLNISLKKTNWAMAILKTQWVLPLSTNMRRNAGLRFGDNCG